jgi:hypothetical protein
VPGPGEEPEPEPEAEPEPAPVIVPEPGAVAGVAGSTPGAVAAAAATEKKEVRKPPRPFLHLGRLGKLGYWTLKEGGPVAKIILLAINVPLYILLFIPGVVATIYYVVKGYKEKKAKEEEEYEAYVAEHGYEEDYDYDQYGEPVPAQPPEGGYYEGDGYYDDESYGY